MAFAPFGSDAGRQLWAIAHPACVERLFGWLVQLQCVDRSLSAVQRALVRDRLLQLRAGLRLHGEEGPLPALRAAAFLAAERRHPLHAVHRR